MEFMSSDQQAARDALRAAWPQLLSEALPVALKASQEDAAVALLVRELWPAMRPDDVMRLDRVDRGFLLRGGPRPDDFDDALIQALAAIAEERFHTSHAGNRHARGAALRKLVGQEVAARLSEIRDEAERLFEARQSHWFASPADIRGRVLQELSDRLLDELATFGGGDDTEPKRKLKTVTALATLGGSTGQRAVHLRKIGDGKTAGFPYVLKFLSRGHWPSMRSFPADVEITLEGFTPALEGKFFEAGHVRRCLECYTRQQGVLTRFINPDGPVARGLERLYADTPDFVERRESGLIVPKGAALALHRRESLRVPDGIVCAVSLSVLLESLLRQVVTVLVAPCGDNIRGGDLLRRAARIVPLQPRTVDLLEVVFDQRSLNLRDAMAHGVFFASDLARLESALAGLSQSLKCLVEDLAAAGADARVFVAPRWDNGRTLDAAVTATAQEQYKPDRNLVARLFQPGRDWRRGWGLMKNLAPDKLDMAQAGSLLWVSGQEDVKRGEGDATHLFAAIHAGLITLEELFRAVHETYGLPVLHVQRENADRVRCGLSILDDQPGHLLDPPALGLVFAKWYDDEEFRRVVDAVRAVRDHVLHGKWQALQDPLHLYSHLITTMIYALCDMVGFEAEANAAATAEPLAEQTPTSASATSADTDRIPGPG
jgi:hypothetical protein